MNLIPILLQAAIAVWAQAPADFDRFWQDAMREASEAAVQVRLEPAPAQSDDKVACFKAHYSSLAGKPVHAWYCRPTGEGPFPGMLISPWYSQGQVPAPRDVAARGFAVLWYQGRGYEVDLSSYPIDNQQYILSGLASPQTYVYREMFARAVISLDVLASFPEVDSKSLGAAGASQGGGLSLVLAGLDPRVAAVSADFPFLCDFLGSLPAAEGPFKDIREYLDQHPEQRVQVESTLRYFDVLNFAPKIYMPVKIQFGLRDRTCPPEGIKLAFGLMPSQDKFMEEFPNADHGDENGPRWQKMLDYLTERLVRK
ncbi:MAG: acetylxylan esterase [Elusimicrobiota bacterium]|jgi:cephalosporin-C deacetylase